MGGTVSKSSSFTSLFTFGKKAKTAPSAQTQPLAAPLLPTEPAAAVGGTPVSGGVFVLANTILGAGMLGLPFAFASCGWYAAPFMLFTFGAMSTSGLVMLSECGMKCIERGVPCMFNDIAETALKGSGMLIDLAVAIKCFGVATSYLVVMSTTVPMALPAFGIGGFWLERRLWVIVALCFGGSLAYMKDLTALKPFSTAALGCVLTITLMVVLFAFHPFYPFLDPCPGDDDYASGCRGPMQTFTSFGSILKVLPVFVFSFTCHQNMVTITSELEKPSSARLTTVAVCSIGVALFVYVFLATSGYSSFGSAVKSNILSNYPQDSVVVAIARLMISLVVSCCYPLQAHPSRKSIVSILEICAGKSKGEWLNAPVPYLVITTTFVACTGTIAFLVSDLGLVLAVVGATGSTIVTYVLPGGCYFLLFPERKSRWVGLFFVCFGALFICPVSLYFTFNK